MTARRRCVACLVAALVAAGTASAQNEPSAPIGWHQPDDAERPAGISDFGVQAPRAYGYVVGDRITHRVAVTVTEGLRLQQASVPERRRIGEWLELQEIGTEESTVADGRRYELILTYQLFSTGIGVDHRTIPGFTLRFDRGGESVPITVPDWTFAQSPLLAGDIADEGDNIVAMRPDIAPAPLATGYYRAGLAAGLALAALGSGWLAWLYAPFAPRRRVFAHAHREMTRLANNAPDRQGLPAAFRLLHRAFDDTAGRAVFARDVEDFCRAHPEFQTEREAIHAFFADSRRLFFEPDRDTAEQFDWQSLRDFARRLRRAERGA